MHVKQKLAILFYLKRQKIDKMVKIPVYVPGNHWWASGGNAGWYESTRKSLEQRFKNDEIL